MKIDYYSPLVTVNRLCLKRILQAIEQLRRQHGKVIFTLAIEQEKYDEVELLIKQIQNAM